MNENELITAANSGDLSAIETYADHLVQNQKYTDAQEWFLRGANLGSYYCMIQYAHLTIVLVEAVINITTNEAMNGIKDLKEAEKWVNILKNADKLKDDSILYGTHGIYSVMTWCYYLVALTTKQQSYYNSVIETYNLIKENPDSRSTYAYIQALDEFGETRKVFDLSSSLVKNPDNTMEKYMLEVLYFNISQAYFEGKIVPANYNLAYENVKLASQANSKTEMLNYFNSGAAKRDFDAVHSKQSSQNAKNNTGCYVATAVYGSYDCPSVWTLRRYRDDILASSWYGRVFIHTYYAISPTIVKWFGNTTWFKNMWRGKLDKLVDKLQEQGIKNTPYDDKKW